jgi:hypothetical protein
MSIARKAWLAALAGATLFCNWTPRAEAALLSVDFNRRNVIDNSTNTASGYSSFVISSNVSSAAIQTDATVRVIGSYTVTLSNSAPNGYDDRFRTQVLTNNGTFTGTELYRDFVFSRDQTTLGGLDLSIAGLNPGETYNITLFSWDQQSAGTRVSDWFANGTMVYDNYTFDGRVYPDDNTDYRFSFPATADPGGVILISGRREANSVDANNAASFGVFLNGFQIDAVPEPGTYALLGLGALAYFWIRRTRRD